MCMHALQDGFFGNNNEKKWKVLEDMMETEENGKAANLYS